MKKGKIGGTRLKQVLAKNNVPLIYELLAEQGLDELEESYKSEAMQWGIDMETFAYNAWNESTGLGMAEYGWIESDLSEIVGLSPDGYNPNLNKAIEIKCPSTKKHVEYIIKGDIPTEYKPQILHYFIVIDDLESLDFISFDPRYKTKPLHIITVTREELADEIEQAKVGLVKFLEKLEKYKLKLK